VLQADLGEQPSIHSPADAANLLMYEMMNLSQEHLRIILLNTRNRVIAIPTVYIGSLNTSVVRLAEVFKPAIVNNAAAVIVVHNHPSTDPSPSPEDVSVTRHLVQTGEMLSIPVLDHIILGRNRFVSLKERQLGFS
jgi:DNA repair protein RadC